MLLVRALLSSLVPTHPRDDRRIAANRRRNYASVKETNDPRAPRVRVLSPLPRRPAPSHARVRDSSPSSSGNDFGTESRRRTDAPATGFRRRSRLSGRTRRLRLARWSIPLETDQATRSLLPGSPRIIGAGNGAENHVMSHGISSHVQGGSIEAVGAIVA